MRSVESTRRRARPARGRPARALVDRGALEALLQECGLAEHAANLAHEVALPSLRIEPVAARSPAPRSRLGGPPLLPAGASWPHTGEGAPLTFLAALDVGELPDAPITSRLPVDHTLLFFADLGTGDGDGLIDEAPNEPGSVARCLATREPVPATPPEALEHPERTVLLDRQICFRALLTLPGWDGAAHELGLDVYEARAYEEAVARLTEAIDPQDGGGWLSGHWIGGHATGIQGAPPDDGTLLLLHLEDDASLGFAFLDGGVIQFRIPDDALDARDWARVVAIADSC
jgi:hypothetical protein